jgi:hypothetical protein
VDATAFSAWANEIIGSEHLYRLVKRAEIDEPAVQRIISAPPINEQPRSIWLASEAAQPELWLPPGAQNPFTVNSNIMVTQIRHDFMESTATLTRLLLLWTIMTVDLVSRDLSLGSSDTHGDSERAGALKASQNLGQKIDAALELDGITHIDFNTAFNVTRTLTLIDARNLAAEFMRHRSRGGDRDLSRAESAARTLNESLSRCLVLADGLIGDDSESFGHGEKHTQRLSGNSNANGAARSLDRILGLDQKHYIRSNLDYRNVSCDALVMGAAMTDALTESLPRAASTQEWRDRFIKAFIDITGVGDNSYVIPPDVMRAELEASLTHLKEPLSNWATHAAQRLLAKARPVFDRKRPLTSHDAASVRLAALCLGAERGIAADEHRGELYAIAAAITLLALRDTGRAPVTETIMLAVD